VRNLSVSPNPAGAVAHVGYTLPRAGSVECSVFDGAGRLVASLASGWQAAGEHRLAWRADGARPGVYIVRVSGAASGSARLVKAD
jgi:hypothetical protein